MNAFEEYFGEHILYAELEQSSYIEFKSIIFETISSSIKFRKYGRIGPVLTVKADFLKPEIDRFKKLLEKDKLQMVHGWVVSNVTIITDNKLLGTNNIEENYQEENFDDI
jgi:hypothetical protein